MRSFQSFQKAGYIAIIVFLSISPSSSFGFNYVNNSVRSIDLEFDNKEIVTEVLFISESVILLKKSYGNVDWYEVVATVITELIPITALGVCIYTTGNIKVCNAIYKGIEVLIAIKENEIKEGLKDGIKWAVKKTESVGSVTIQTNDYEDAKAAMNVFNEYRDRDCFSWDKVKLTNSEGIVCMPASKNIDATYNETAEWLESRMGKLTIKNEKYTYEKTFEITYESGGNIFFRGDDKEKYITVETVKRSDQSWFSKYYRIDQISLKDVDARKLKIKRDKYDNPYILISSIKGKDSFLEKNIAPIPFSNNTHRVRLHIPSDPALQGRILFALSYAVNQVQANNSF